MAYVLGHCQAKILFCAPDNKALIDEVLSNLKEHIQVIVLHPEDGPVWPEGLSNAAQTENAAPHRKQPGVADVHLWDNRQSKRRCTFPPICWRQVGMW